ncbi:MAG TPA: helix-turn-helix domain-containing protein, partial [Vicinamibacteria bacterium]|nr:helix-turn-helix domain-containing protein [Vicinamibacteria bacterium]
LRSMERTMIQDALQSARFDKSKAAKALGLTRQQLSSACGSTVSSDYARSFASPSRRSLQ